MSEQDKKEPKPQKCDSTFFGFNKEEADRVFGKWDEPFVELQDCKLYEDDLEVPDVNKIRKEAEATGDALREFYKEEKWWDEKQGVVHCETANHPAFPGTRQCNGMPDLDQVREKKSIESVKENYDLRVLSGIPKKGVKKDRFAPGVGGQLLPWTMDGNNMSHLRQTWIEAKKDNSLHSSGLPVYLQNIVEGDVDVFDVEVNNYCKLAGLKYRVGKEDLLNESLKLSSCRDFCAELLDRIDLLVENYNQRGVDNTI